MTRAEHTKRVLSRADYELLASVGRKDTEESLADAELLDDVRERFADFGVDIPPLNPLTFAEVYRFAFPEASTWGRR